MKERVKKKLTKEIILKDLGFAKDAQATETTFLWLGLGLCFLMLLCILINCIPSKAVLILLPLSLGGVAIPVLTYLKNEKSSVVVDNYVILEDYVVKKKCESGSDFDSYYLYFYKSGRIEVGYYESGNEYRPGYCEARLGEYYYVVKNDKLNKPLMYSRDIWRLEDPTEEQLAQELREEDELMEAVMQCERFPRFTVRKNHYADADPMAYLKGNLQKPDAERSFLERLAAKQFHYDRVNAIEYVLRYCPPDIQHKVADELTENERNLWTAITGFMK